MLRALTDLRKYISISSKIGVILGVAFISNISASFAMDAVAIDRGQAKVFRVSRPAGTIVIGNPKLLSANLQDSETLILTGLAHGTTNMIVLDKNGEAILDRLIVVEENEASTVRVYSQGVQSTFACHSSCNPTNN